MKFVKLAIFFYIGLFLASNAMGAAYYIDPDWTGTQSGTESEPFDSWSDVTWAAGNQYYQKRGTTFTGYLNPSTGGTSGNEITIGAYSTGDRPIVQGSGSQYAMQLNNRNYFIIQDIEFRNTDYNVVTMQGSFGDFHDVTWQRCKFVLSGTSGTNDYCVYLFSLNYDIHDVLFDNNEFEVNTTTSSHTNVCLRFQHSANLFYNITISNNTITGTGQGIQFYASNMATVDSNNSSAYGIDIDGNTFVDNLWQAITTTSGLNNTSQSYIRNNTFTNIGHADHASINALQLSWCRGLIVEDNTITNVYTSDPDGCGIIIDWSWTDSGHLSDACIIRRNIVSGCMSGTLGTSVASGIQIYAGTNTQVYYNVTYGNHAGISNMLTHSTGSVFYNNTMYSNNFGGNSDDGATGNPAPASTWINNIFSNNTTFGFRVANGSENPTETYNCFYGSGTFNINNSTTGEVAINSTSMIAAPQLDATYEPGNRVLLSAGKPLDGFHDVLVGQYGYGGRHVSSIPIGAVPGATLNASSQLR